MATLTTDEMARIKAELFDNVLAIGAVPWIDVRAIYDIIQANVTSSSVSPTTSSTTVSTPGPVVLTLASVAELSSGNRLVLDVDAGREVVTVRAVSGNTVSVLCSKTHSGTYPVEVESPLTIVRGLIADLETVDQQERLVIPQAGIAQVDEIKFFGRSEGGGPIQGLTHHRDLVRSRLAASTGLTGILRTLRARASSSGSSSYEAY